MPRSRLFRRKDSRFFWAEYTAPDGSTVRQSTGCRDLGSAKEWLAARELERHRAACGIPVAQRVSLELAAAEYLTLRQPDWSTGWRKTVEAMFRDNVLPWFKPETAVGDISRAQVERFRVAQVGRPRKGRPGKIETSTVNRMMAALAAFGQWCAHPDRAYTLTNPFAGHKPFPEDERPPPSLSEADLAAWLAQLPVQSRAAGKPHVRAIVTLAVETGLRKSELGRLRWEEVDLDARRLWVVSTRKRGLTKSRRTRAQVLTSRAVEALESLPKRGDGYVFGPIPDIRKSMRSAAARAGIGEVWFHATRHFGASRVGALGASDGDLQAWGGWSNPRMVRRYDHSNVRRLQSLADRLNGPAGVRSSHVPETTQPGETKTA